MRSLSGFLVPIECRFFLLILSMYFPKTSPERNAEISSSKSLPWSPGAPLLLELPLLDWPFATVDAIRCCFLSLTRRSRSWTNILDKIIKIKFQWLMHSYNTHNKLKVAYIYKIIDLHHGIYFLAFMHRCFQAYIYKLFVLG